VSLLKILRKLKETDKEDIVTEERERRQAARKSRVERTWVQWTLMKQGYVCLMISVSQKLALPALRGKNFELQCTDTQWPLLLYVYLFV